MTEHQTHTPWQHGRLAAELGCPMEIPLGMRCMEALEWMKGYKSVPRITPSQEIRVVQLPYAEGLPLPSYATGGAAGMDLLAAVDCVLVPSIPTLIQTGLTIAVPPGHELQIRPRSGLALKHALTVLNSPGTIDEDYRGEIGVIMMNMGRFAYEVKRGERIAQAVLAPVTRAHWKTVDALDETGRGNGGFGSTGA